AVARARRGLVAGERSRVGRTSGAAGTPGSPRRARVPRAPAASPGPGRRCLRRLGRRRRSRRRVRGRHDPRGDVAARDDGGARRRAGDGRARAAALARRRSRLLPRRRSRRALAGRGLPRLSPALGQAADPGHRGPDDADDRGNARAPRRRSARAQAGAMRSAELFGISGAAAVGLGLYGLVVNPNPLRKILAFDLLGGGVFLLFAVVARRGAAADFGGDPVPQALIITGLVVAFAATALAVALA